MALAEYEVTINGVTTHMQLSAEDAKALGASTKTTTVKATKAKAGTKQAPEPENK